ncbi:transcription factor ILR3 isoform X2 [Musa acuminata AAA Group]|uniref:transcription factor ILR3 isoform X2 n=1 Tax=Musa acuminata AAA Group TaxID=214697 RepID=UPI0031DA8F37
MGSSENPAWFLDDLIGDMHASEGDLAGVNGGFCWAPPGFNISFSKRSETCSTPAKACREKMRRDRLNDRFLELGSLLEPGKLSKLDKAAILSDAVRVLTQLRSETEKLKESNEILQEKINELKAEKNELRDEKQKLKAENESLEQQIKLRSSYVSHPPPVIATPFTAKGQAAAQKLMIPIIGYPGFPMWQFMAPSDIDTSQDADKYPPAA